MRIVTLGRTLPQRNTGSFGLFEFQQAKAISEFEESGFLFIENSSLLSTRKVSKINMIHDSIPTVGAYLPIKGLPPVIYDSIRTKLFISAYNDFCSTYWKPEVIHVHFPLLVLNHKIIDFLLSQNVRIVVTEHWTKVQKKEISNKQVKLLNRILLVCRKFICVSEDLKESITELCDYKGDKITVIPNMISDIFFETENKETDDFIFTYIGRLTHVKRVDLLIKAFQNTFAEESKVKLVIIGDGPEKSKISNLISNDFKERIMLLGNQPKEVVAEKLETTSVYVSASNYETFGVPFIEALAMGIPVIAANNLPVRKYINGDNGLLFKVDDLDDLSSKMKNIYSNFESYDEKLIKEEIKELFSPDSVSLEIIKTYK